MDILRGMWNSGLRQAPWGPVWGLLLAVMIVTTPSCERVQDKLKRLASAGQVEAPVPEEAAPLTEEEKRLNDLLKDPALFDSAPVSALPVAEVFELNRSAVVSILGYHDFRERGAEAMIIEAAKFRAQMQNIKDSKIPVIPLSELMAWRRGERNIPEESFVITMDDGWEGVYRFAFPVLKEMGFPFTVYLYKNYVNVGGRSMSWAQIQEMIDSGLCEVGSHSVTHSSMTAKKGRSEEAYQLYLLSELKDSKEFLEKNLGLPCTSFAYPYGNYNTMIRDLGHQVGYESLVTVNGSKVTWDTPLGELGRFIILGDNDAAFQLATSFRGRGSVDSSSFVLMDAKDEEGSPKVVLRPRIDEVVQDRMPLIEANLSGLAADIVPGSVRMHVAGLGSVPVVWDAETQTARFQVPHRLRRETCEVTLTFQRVKVAKPETLLWRFKIDLAASYLPRETVVGSE